MGSKCFSTEDSGQDKNSQLVVDMPPEVGQVAQKMKAPFKDNRYPNKKSV